MGADEDAKKSRHWRSSPRPCIVTVERSLPSSAIAAARLSRASWGCRRRCRASAVRDLSIGTLPRPLTVPEIERMVADFAEAAGRCKAAGFDGVQIHAGHGYLIGQFLTPYTNRRTDAYGGSLEGRTKLLRDSVPGQCVFGLGRIYPIIIKINGSGLAAAPRRAEDARACRGRADHGARRRRRRRGFGRGGRSPAFPVVHGTFWRCLQGMANGSVRFLPGLWRLCFSRWPGRCCRPGLQPHLGAQARGYTWATPVEFKAGARGAGHLRRRVRHPGQDAKQRSRMGTATPSPAGQGLHRRALPLPALP